MPDVAPPLLITGKARARQLARLPRVHTRFDESFLQALLADHPELLPVGLLREDAGALLCVGREVPTHGSGTIDNLYLSTGGYPVVVETKLWRNPQARREVISQALDYVKELVNKDYDWFQKSWQQFVSHRQSTHRTVLQALGELADEGLDEGVYIDRLHRALSRGDIIALIVGDGIETRLQRLVSHLCRDSAHLRYVFGLVELRFYTLNADEESLIVIPRLVQEVEPVQRAFVRIDFAPGVAEKLEVKSVVEIDDDTGPVTGRIQLNEEDFRASLQKALGEQKCEAVEQFYRGLLDELELEADFKSRALMLKVPDPTGEKPGASVLAIESQGRVYNPDHLRRQLRTWGVDEPKVEDIVKGYWQALNGIDTRFKVNGMTHVRPRDFLPLFELIGKFSAIAAEIRKVVRLIGRATEDIA